MTECVGIRDLCDTMRLTINPASNPDKHFFYFSIPAFDAEKEPNLVLGRDIKSSKLFITEPCLLFSRLNPRIRRVWDLSILPKTHQCVASTEFVPFVIRNSNRLFSRYLYWFMFTDHFLSVARAGVRAATKSRERVNKDHLFDVPILLPPLPEQRRIAAILDKADAIRRKRQEGILLMEEFLHSVFSDMFGNIGNFDHVKIQDIASKKKHALSSGPFGSNLTSAHYTNEGVIVLRGLNISKGRLNLDDVKFVSEQKAQSLVRSEVRPGDIVVVAVGSSGLACQIPNSLPRAIMSQNFNKISPDLNKTNPIYLEYCINSLFVQRQLKKEITDTVRTFLSLTKLKNVEIPLPPLRDQEKFAQVVRKSEQLRTKQRRAKRKSDDIFNSLVQRAFRRELKGTEAELVKNRENRNGNGVGPR